MNEETSESGAPIYRYTEGENRQWTAPDMSDSSLDAITDHIKKHIGPISLIWHEILSNIVHIDVHQVAPTEDRPYWTLVTSGMSDMPMKTSERNVDWAYSEIMICLPKGWKLDEASLKNEDYYWPIRALKILARFPHEYKTWLSWGHSMPNGNPAKPITDLTPFVGYLLLRPKTTSRDFWTLKIRENKKVQFLALYPLLPDEMTLKLKAGAIKIDEIFERRKVTELVDIGRKDATTSNWWHIW